MKKKKASAEAIRKKTWRKAFKSKKVTITFDSEVFPEIRKLLGMKNLKCSYCGKRITKNNIGGILTNKKIICRNMVCMIQAIESGDL